MKRFVSRAVAASATTAVVAGLAVAIAPASSAAVIGTLTLSPFSGGGFTAYSATTSQGCPAAATNFQVRFINGPAGSNISAATPVGTNGNASLASVGSAGGNAAGFTFPVGAVLNSTRVSAGVGALPVGDYTLEAFCRTAGSSATLGEFTATIRVTEAITATAGAWNQPAPVSATTTTLSPATQSKGLGDTYTVTATVANTGSSRNNNPTGTVQFKKGGVNVGSAVAVTASGALDATATSAAISASAVGTDSITAEYVPAGGANFTGSTASAVTVTVGKATTTTTVDINNPAPNTTTNIVLSAQVAKNAAAAPGTPSGTVTFTYGGTTSAPVAVNGSGVASLAIGQQAQGALSYSATYSGDASFDGSSSAAGNVTVASIPAYQLATEYVRTVVEDGALTISVNGFNVSNPSTSTGRTNLNTGNKAYGIVNGTLPTSNIDGLTGIGANRVVNGFGPYATYGNQANTFGTNVGTVASNVVYLPNALLNAAGTYIETVGNIIPLRVTDTRAGDLGYNVTGAISALDNILGVSNAATDRISAQNVGWDPIFISASRPGIAVGTGLVEGATVQPAADDVAAAAIAGNVSGSTYGIAAPKRLFQAEVGKSSGTVVYGATLEIKAPTQTLPGVFEGVLEVTAL